ncbi:MAG: glycosyltransferase family 2 protein [Pirellulaceae bacterium]|nr:glycosyltransferase family 2 protein [Pirellulaceae bacterium]MDP7016745.1 glycosyltransferase family 2 protein [Pirellulaceae bacterium]
MSQSISVILPIHNCQQTISRQIDEMLEVLPEMTGQFEVIIVDDCSTDDSEEVAVELSRRFPQVQLVRHRMKQGRQSAVRTGMEMSQGDVIFVQEEGVRLRAAELRQLWDLREDQELVMARSTPKNRNHSIPICSGV